MAFDAGMLRACVFEIDTLCREGKVERVCQPNADSIDLIIHKGRDNRHVFISASNNTPRISVSEIQRENPIVAPTFCMLLRKHLAGAKLISAYQDGFERIALLKFSAYDEMGYECEKTLICEIMGRCSNIILINSDKKILASIKTVDFSVSSKRQIIPGLYYESPPGQDKTDPLSESEEHFVSLAKGEKDMPFDKFIMSNYLGVSSEVSREIAYLSKTDCAGNTDSLGISAFSSWFTDVRNNVFSPTLYLDGDNIPTVYSYRKLSHLGGIYKEKPFESPGIMLDNFYFEKERIERVKQRGADIIHIISSAKSRLTKKISLQSEELSESQKGEEYKNFGDLITSNIYLIKKGMNSFECIDYSKDDMPKISVPLNSRLTPAQNAQKMYKIYNKSKNAKKILGEQIKKSKEEIEYFHSIEVFLSAAETEQDLIEIREELKNSGYAKKTAKCASVKNKKPKFTEYKSQGGYRMLCGRNNIQNDELTFKIAEKGDLWFHVKGMHGSHVILICSGEEPSERDYTEAAELAAYYSEADKNAPVEVDYTRVKNIKKPQGAKPGFVIYHTNYSAYVMPKLPKEEE